MNVGMVLAVFLNKVSPPTHDEARRSLSEHCQPLFYAFPQIPEILRDFYLQ